MGQMEVAGITFDPEALDQLTLDQLTAVYNVISGSDPITRFRDKATGQARVAEALARHTEAAAPPLSVQRDEDTHPRGQETNMFDDANIITVLASSNPKRPGSKAHERFARYRVGMTVGEAKADGLSRDIRHDLARGYIKISGRP
jgi:hypothetical protein